MNDKKPLMDYRRVQKLQTPLLLTGALLSGADISRDLSVLKLQMETRTELSGDDLQELGREIATPAEAREILSLKPLQ